MISNNPKSSIRSWGTTDASRATRGPLGKAESWRHGGGRTASDGLRAVFAHGGEALSAAPPSREIRLSRRGAVGVGPCSTRFARVPLAVHGHPASAGLSGARDTPPLVQPASALSHRPEARTGR